VATPDILIPEAITTERLLIRVVSADDILDVNTSIRENFDVLSRWMEWATAPHSLHDTEQWVQHAIAHFNERTELNFVIRLRDGHAHVGNISLHHIVWDVPCFEIGYWQRKVMSGLGYMTEAVRGLSTLALDSFGAQRLEIRCDSRNTASARVAQRAGFIHEATLRRNRRDMQGSLSDTLIFALLRGQG
jgi:RimJ/RimL family protein N-acetyltransferase